MTYEQLINVLRTYQQNHKSLKSFFEGDIWDYDKLQERLYPVMTVVLQPSALDNNLENFTIEIGYFDKVELDFRNRINVLSDTKLLCKDFISLCKSPVFMSNKLYIQLPITPTPYIEKFDDAVGGWLFTVTLNQFEAYDNCLIPKN